MPSLLKYYYYYYYQTMAETVSQYTLRPTGLLYGLHILSLNDLTETSLCEH